MSGNSGYVGRLTGKPLGPAERRSVALLRNDYLAALADLESRMPRTDAEYRDIQARKKTITDAVAQLNYALSIT